MPNTPQNSGATRKATLRSHVPITVSLIGFFSLALQRHHQHTPNYPFPLRNDGCLAQKRTPAALWGARPPGGVAGGGSRRSRHATGPSEAPRAPRARESGAAAAEPRDPPAPRRPRARTPWPPRRGDPASWRRGKRTTATRMAGISASCGVSRRWGSASPLPAPSGWGLRPGGGGLGVGETAKRFLREAASAWNGGEGSGARWVSLRRVASGGAAAGASSVIIS